jgi:hypothetical protein
MANVPTTSWSETSPAGNTSISSGDDRIRELKTQIREVIGVDHDFPSSGQATDNGQHLQVTLQEQTDLGTGAEGTTILGNQTISGKGELVYTDEDDNDIQITKSGKLYPSQSTTLADWAAVMNLVYPVGSLYFNGSVSTNPATLLGIGTWSLFGAGKVPVCVDTSDTDFDVLGETIGAKTITLTAAQSGLPAHNHTEYAVNGGSGSFVPQANTSGGAGGTICPGTVTANNATAAASESHSNIQPSIVCAIWQRTA